MIFYFLETSFYDRFKFFAHADKPIENLSISFKWKHNI